MGTNYPCGIVLFTYKKHLVFLKATGVNQEAAQKFTVYFFDPKSLSASSPQPQPLVLLFIGFLLVSLNVSDFYQQLQPINPLASKFAASPRETSLAAQLILLCYFCFLLFQQ